MTTLISRRAFIPAITLATLGANTLLHAKTAVTANITATNIAAGISVFNGAGGNVVVHESAESIILIDGGAADHSADLLNTIAEHFNGKPIKALVNTHWHLAQTGSNDTLGAKDIPIIAHENTKRWMTTSIEQHWNTPAFPPRNKIALPTRTFYVNDELQHGPDLIKLTHTPRAHTDGDIHATFTKANVIAAGGVVYSGSYPVLDTATNGWIGEMLDATRKLLSQADQDTIIIPSDGRLLNRDDLLSQEEMLDTILTRFQELSRQGKGAEDMLAEGIAKEYVEDRGDPTEFILTAWDGLWDHMSGLRAF